MSHATGKIEIMAVDQSSIYLRYHQAKDPANLGRLLVAERDDAAGWLDELRIRDWTNAQLSPKSTMRTPAWQEPRTVLVANSPLQLNELERTIATEIKADEWAAEIAPSLTKRAEKEPPYKVDELCEDYVDRMLHRYMRDRVSETAYEHGIERGAVLAVLRVILRNRLLSDTGRDPHAGRSTAETPAPEGGTTAPSDKAQ